MPSTPYWGTVTPLTSTFMLNRKHYVTLLTTTGAYTDPESRPEAWRWLDVQLINFWLLSCTSALNKELQGQGTRVPVQFGQLFEKSFDVVL